MGIYVSVTKNNKGMCHSESHSLTVGGSTHELRVPNGVRSSRLKWVEGKWAGADRGYPEAPLQWETQLHPFFPYNSLDIKTRNPIYVFYNKSNDTEMYKERISGFTEPTLILARLIPLSCDWY